MFSKKINYIRIEYVKGILDKKFELDLIPNKPNIFVAPNGFGKSSFATAFRSLNKNNLRLDNKEDFYENNESNKEKARIEIEITDQDDNRKIIIADDKINSINKEIDVFVINNALTAKSKNQNFGSFHTTSRASLEVPDIILKNTIPKKESFKYEYSQIKNDFGNNGKILVNIKSYVQEEELIIGLFTSEVFQRLSQKTNIKKLDRCIVNINILKGNAIDIKKKIIEVYLKDLESIDDLRESVNIFKNYKQNLDELDEVDCYLTVYQFNQVRLQNKRIVADVIRFLKYEKFKKNSSEIIESLGGTWKKIKPREVKGRLLIKFPDARHISNGERGAISFLGNLIKQEERINKEISILIIDEVFDCLDDANLIVCQYYISKFIKKLKNNRKQIFPIILTHLNPYYFKSFVFSDQKVYFLNKSKTQINKNLSFVIENRDKETIKDDLDRFFLHFNIVEKDIGLEFEELKLNKILGKSEKFKEYVESEFKKYQNDKVYDPLAVCTYLRISIEKYCYEKISNIQKTDFIKVHKTVKKLDFAKENGVEIPEIFYLLGIVYNDGLHVSNNTDWATPLKNKLENTMVKNMIKMAIEKINRA